MRRPKVARTFFYPPSYRAHHLAAEVCGEDVMGVVLSEQAAK